MGAVFNRNELGRVTIYNRGWKPLPPGINFSLKITLNQMKSHTRGLGFRGLEYKDQGTGAEILEQAQGGGKRN
jgi:hypothetical protein